MSPISHTMPSPLADRAHGHLDEVASLHKPSRDTEEHQTNGAPERAGLASTYPQSSPSSHPRGEVEYVSKIGVLTSSLPMYHNQFMKARRADQDKKRLREQGESLETQEAEMMSNISIDAASPERSTEQQAETARRLKPHSRSTIQLQNITANVSNPEQVVFDVRTRSKHKAPRWQFGIRSRNEPVDAIKCLYKALESMGDCQWHINPPNYSTTVTHSKGDGTFPVNVKGATHLTSKESSLSESPEKERRHLRLRRTTTNEPGNEIDDSGGDSSSDVTPTEPVYDEGYESEKEEDVDPTIFPPDYVPKDPWCIHVRWEKKGMSPPGATNASSAQSSRVDLVSIDGSNRRSSILGSVGSAQGSAVSFGGSEAMANFNDTACFVYMDLQIYVLEAETYLVDFKSAGYEAIVGERQVRNHKGEIITEYVGSGNRKSDKDVTSPQPFLDLANKLVIHLARGAQ